ncbi:M23 family metallopeptidase [Pacificimonas sp. WHA3]|uniref:M23 family metallopeptidase n=1 Tax=Pacificimonas pallii TaxID=2827236 RepID=A0ABS6SDS3_9SPHN|nr:M23 family metallopeptidase [Pacificimonas pallii]MBV7256076.1 M23 family metallopeptidase [Pacificimonas pallii]
MRRVLFLALLGLSACAIPRSQAPFEAGPAAAPAEIVPEPPRARERWQPGQVIADAVRVETQTYIVQAGDALSLIAERTGSAVRTIARANRLQPPYKIYPGQRLEIPGGRYHRVRRGDTGIAIALAYKTDWDEIVQANALDAPFLLRIGQRLFLPDAASPQRAETMDAPADTPEPAPSELAAFNVDIDDIITGGEPAIAEEDAPAERASALPEPAPFDGRFTWPVEGRLLSSFGAKAGGLYNDGINIAADKGAPVRAAATGTVIYAGNGVEGWGNLVLLKHDEDWVSAYAHNDAFYVQRGDRVGRGEVIAEVGQTGSVTRPQLHFELRQGRKAVDPRAHLPTG